MEHGRPDRIDTTRPARASQVVARNLETFLSEHQWRDRLVPFFVEREMRAFLDCDISAHGFVRVHCDSFKKTLPSPETLE